MDKLIVAIIRHEVLEKLSSVLKKENVTCLSIYNLEEFINFSEC